MPLQFDLGKSERFIRLERSSVAARVVVLLPPRALQFFHPLLDPRFRVDQALASVTHASFLPRAGRAGTAVGMIFLGLPSVRPGHGPGIGRG